MGGHHPVRSGDHPLLHHVLLLPPTISSAPLIASRSAACLLLGFCTFQSFDAHMRRLQSMCCQCPALGVSKLVHKIHQQTGQHIHVVQKLNKPKKAKNLISVIFNFFLV
jgi:hypothetical protein